VILSGGGRSGSRDARFEGEYQSMSLAPCASAPSHPLHAMPPWITRNSDRPRASDRTMVDTQIPVFACQVSRLDWHGHDQKHETSGEEQTSQIKTSSALRSTREWAGSRDKILSFSGQWRTFFLTSLFIELIDLDRMPTCPADSNYRPYNGTS